MRHTIVNFDLVYVLIDGYIQNSDGYYTSLRFFAKFLPSANHKKW